MILKCDCVHEFQDKAYGKGLRVHNPTTKGYRCTVCSKEKIGTEKMVIQKSEKSDG